MLNIEPTIFENFRTGEKSFGVRVFDEYGQDYDNTWESIPDDDKDIFDLVMENKDLKLMIDTHFEVYSTLMIGGAEYSKNELDYDSDDDDDE